MPEQPPPNWSLLTRLIHEGERAQPPAGVPTATPIYTSATYIYDSAAALDNAFATGEGYVYARYGNPTVGALEQVLAAAEGGAGAVAFGSGMAALHAALLAAGTPRGSTSPNVRAVLAARDLYGATTNLLETFFAAQEIPVAYCDMCDLAAVDAAIEATKPNVILVEQISNPLLKVVDVAALAQRAKAAGARLVVDSTMTTPIIQRPLALGADLVVHSATKYLNGHADVTAGAIIGARPLIEAAWEYARVHGPVLHPFEAWLLRRGLQTYGLRMAAHNRNALDVARFLESHSAVERVYFPGLASHPQHELARRQMTGGYGGMLAFELKGGYDAAYRAIRRTRVCLLAVSLGGVETLIVHPASMIHAHQSDDQRATAGISPGLIRLSVGVEDAADIIADLAQALE